MITNGIFLFSINIFPENAPTQEKESGEAEELGMDNMQGVFLVLEIGTLFACVYGCVELVVTVYRSAKKAKVYSSRLFFSIE